MEIHWLAILLAALIPLVIGGIWYNPKVLGSLWLREADMTEDKIKSGNMALIFGLTYVFSILMALFLHVWTIHQNAMYSMLIDEPGFGDPNSEVGLYLRDFMSKYGSNFRTFSHGSTHGVLAALFFALPILAINALFERRSWRYVMVHTGYWVITLALMGGLICAWD